MKKVFYFVLATLAFACTPKDNAPTLCTGASPTTVCIDNETINLSEIYWNDPGISEFRITINGTAGVAPNITANFLFYTYPDTGVVEGIYTPKDDGTLASTGHWFKSYDCSYTSSAPDQLVIEMDTSKVNVLEITDFTSNKITGSYEGWFKNKNIADGPGSYPINVVFNNILFKP